MILRFRENFHAYFRASSSIRKLIIADHGEVIVPNARQSRVTRVQISDREK